MNPEEFPGIRSLGDSVVVWKTGRDQNQASPFHFDFAGPGVNDPLAAKGRDQQPIIGSLGASRGVSRGFLIVTS